MGVLEMDSRPFPAPLPHGNPVPFPPPPESRLRTSDWEHLEPMMQQLTSVLFLLL